MSQPEKAQFIRLDREFNEVAWLDVQFNPTEFSLNKAVQFAEVAIPGLDMPILQFVRGQTETLSLDLFFDSTEAGMGQGATAVTEKTDLFYELVKIDRETHAPPVCRFVWGKPVFPGSNLTGNWASQSRENGFQCVVESVRQRFSLFSPEGVPLRAVLTVALKEFHTLEQQVQAINFHSSDHTRSHTVTRGDTLSGIAGQEYGNPGLWRVIADANRLDDPLELFPGMTLVVPPIQPRPVA